MRMDPLKLKALAHSEDCTLCHGHGDISAIGGTLVWSECPRCGVNQDRPVTREDIQKSQCKISLDTTDERAKLNCKIGRTRT